MGKVPPSRRVDLDVIVLFTLSVEFGDSKAHIKIGHNHFLPNYYIFIFYSLFNHPVSNSDYIASWYDGW
jgi:hypothetical protein